MTALTSIALPNGLAFESITEVALRRVATFRSSARSA